MLVVEGYSMSMKPNEMSTKERVGSKVCTTLVSVRGRKHQSMMCVAEAKVSGEVVKIQERWGVTRLQII